MNNVIPIAAPTGSALILYWANMSLEALTVLYDLRWMVVLVAVLIFSDFWLGVSASLRRKEEFRFSRAGRRTCGKFVEYITYLLLGALLGLSITEPLSIATHTQTAAVALGVGCLWELDSIIEHVCTLHNIKQRFSLKRLVIAMLRIKSDKAAKAVEEVLTDEDKKNNNNDRI